MLALDQSPSVTIRELDTTLSLIEELSDQQWQSEVRCQGWQVADLASHLAEVAWVQGEAFHRMFRDSTETPEIPDQAPGARAETLIKLRSGRDHLAEACAQITAAQADNLVALPFGTLPCSLAMQVALIEYGVHRNDLESALGKDGPMAPEAASAIVELLPAFLPILSTVAPTEPTSYRLTTPNSSVSVVCSGDTWTVGEDPEVSVCEISGNESAVSLFAMGRIPAMHQDLTTDGDMEVAGRFKHYFPGP